MLRKTIKRTVLTLTMLSAVLGAVSAHYGSTLPDSFYIQKGETLSINSALPVTPVPADAKTMEVFSVGGLKRDTVSLRLFGVVPIKNAEIREIETPMLIPGGQPFGIKLRMDGAMVISFGAIDTDKGAVCPAKEAGLEEGDIITSADGFSVSSGESLSTIIDDSRGSPVSIRYTRSGRENETTLIPVFSEDNDCYAAGMWVRDSLAGVGTVSYYDPENMTFGGLGHPICDGDTGVCIPIGEGAACPVTISGLTKGTRGNPGMLEGTFLGGEEIGSLCCNNRCGVFGRLSGSCPREVAIPMAFKQEITTGDGEIICTIAGEKPERYSVRIIDTDLSGSDNTKNMIIEVTDKELLRKTGGIVQGMSGSPIIKDGKLIGAVTHVFVDEPSKGYGIFCENMYSQSRLLGN